MFRKVLDIDFTSKYAKVPPMDIDTVCHILEQIVKCPNLEHIDFSYSSFKGCHIILHCLIDCDLCRLCFDDDKHFAYDMSRPEYARNIVFEKKEKVLIKC